MKRGCGMHTVVMMLKSSPVVEECCQCIGDVCAVGA